MYKFLHLPILSDFNINLPREKVHSNWHISQANRSRRDSLDLLIYARQIAARRRRM